mmetsp:Transcript_67264/g.179161  ORF Transcript_67264/g.179161 Transcript_67264/m.179161 type:complete len:207 (-) Transcript_67264:292-912(-)
MEEVTLLTNDALLRSEGLDSFPKEYKVKQSMGFYCYIGTMAVFILYVTFGHPVIFYGELEPALLLFDVAYFGSVWLFILFQLPRSVVRERDFLVVTFCCRKRKVPISEIEEIRIIHSLDCKSQMHGCRWKCVWGFPTRMDKTVFIFTHSLCDNYQLGLADMEGFLADNRPRDDPSPQVVGLPAEEPAASSNAQGTSLDRVAIDLQA